MVWLRKAFSIGDLKFGWILLVSLAVCAAVGYIDLVDNPEDQFWLAVGYAVAFGLAVLWSGVNYVGHIRLAAMYRKMNDIGAYVEQLAMGAEDKAELRNYLEDYAQDLIRQGKSERQATAEAISQFQVKELLRLSKHTDLFQLHAHYYLLGWTACAALLVLLIELTKGVFPSESLAILLAESIAAAYGASFVCLFFVYKLLDAFIYRTLRKHLF
ncbi:permease prefix domain 1-containing protein [Cohnella massiliensis]|uniref:permease prefix domain 1-containing protein n=1 Tax=Cohnella massiliensis TaxID=1816691 RepID=UPI0009B9B5A8|nr:permease prefix domain 1-containing protein [Cohnella massiliensis]